MPETRPLQGGGGGGGLGRAPSSLSMSAAFVEEGKGRQREQSWGGQGEKEWPLSPQGGSSGTMSPEAISRGGSPIYPSFDSRNASRASFSGLGSPMSPGGMNSSNSRASMASSFTQSAPRRSLYGLNAHSSGPQLRSPTLPPTTRIAGAPHAAHTRVDIVPPLPLAPPPGTVVSMDKKTLAFAPSSGIGKDGELVNLEAPFGEGHSFPPPRQHSGTATPSSSGSSPHRSSARGYGQGHLPTHSSSSSHPSTSSSHSSARNAPPPIITSNLHLALGGGPASPLDKLQQRIKEEARRDAKGRERSERVRRANEGDDGTWSQSESGRSSAGQGSDERR